MLKLLERKVKQKILKTTSRRKNKDIAYRVTNIRNIEEVVRNSYTQPNNGKGNKNGIFKMMNCKTIQTTKTYQPRILYLEKICFNNKGETKTF